MKKNLILLVVIVMSLFIGFGKVYAAELEISEINPKKNTFDVILKNIEKDSWKFTYKIIGKESIPTTDYFIKTNNVPTDRFGILNEISNYKVNFKINNMPKEETIIEFRLSNVNQTKQDVVKTFALGKKPEQKLTTTTTKPITTTVSKSNNTFLADLKISTSKNDDLNLSPLFKKDIYDYTVDVESSVDKVIINPIAEDSKSNIVISNNSQSILPAGETTKIVVTVTAENGDKRAYNILIKKAAEASNATLSKLEIENLPNFKFDEEIYKYNVKIKNDVKNLNLIYETSDDKSVVEVIGNKNLKNGSKIKVLVTAEDGSKREYILNIIKEEKKATIKKEPVKVEEKNPIIIMAFSMVAFSLMGSIFFVIKK